MSGDKKVSEGMDKKKLNLTVFGDGDGSEPIRHPLQRIIKDDVEHFKRTLNDPEPPKVWEYGDDSGLRVRVFEVADDRCPLCGEEHDKSVTFNGVVMVACPEIPTGHVLPLRRVDSPGPYTLTPPLRAAEGEE